MHSNESPPKKSSLGGSMKVAIKSGLVKGKNLIKTPSKSATSPTVPLIYSNDTLPSSQTDIPASSQSKILNHQQYYHHHHHHNQPYKNNNNRDQYKPNSNQYSYAKNNSSKRAKRNAWGSRERAGMSFLIVIAFFAVFGLIIITEIFMIDEKNSIIASNRLGDSVPDYYNVKDDYDIIENNKIYQFQKEIKFKINRAGGGGGGGPLSFGLPIVSYGDNDGKKTNRAASDGHNKYIGGARDDGGGGVFKKAIPGVLPWGQTLDNRIEVTLPHFPIGVMPKDGIWQIVNGTRFKFFVYSAYYDRRNGKMVRVIAATKTHGPEKVWCRFWYRVTNSSNNNNHSNSNRTKYSSATVSARIKMIRENWNLKYSASFVLCPVRAGIDIPYSISIVSRLRAPPGNVILVRNTDDDIDFVNNTLKGSITNIPDNIAICVKPFHFDYDQALHLIEFLELNTLLGISHFTFYNHTLGPKSSCILKHYIDGDIPDNLTAVDDYDYEKFNVLVANISEKKTEHNSTVKLSTPILGKPIKRKNVLETIYKKPTVNLLPWDLRMRSQAEIRTENLFAALNDCLYRNMYRYKYLALIDLDEFIMPHFNDTLGDLLRWINVRFESRNAGSYSFQNAFFYQQFPDDPLIYEPSMNPALRAALMTQRKTKRKLKLHPQKQRSKYICKPEFVVEAGNHFVWEFVPGRGSLNVPSTAGILHHYRVCEFGGDDCIKSPSIIQRTATKYAKRLLARVDTVYNYLKRTCNLDDLPSPTKPKTIVSTMKQNKKQQDFNDNAGDGVVKVKVRL